MWRFVWRRVCLYEGVCRSVSVWVYREGTYREGVYVEGCVGVCIERCICKVRM